jgi:hypothetical protein
MIFVKCSWIKEKKLERTCMAHDGLNSVLCILYGKWLNCIFSMYHKIKYFLNKTCVVLKNGYYFKPFTFLLRLNLTFGKSTIPVRCWTKYDKFKIQTK